MQNKTKKVEKKVVETNKEDETLIKNWVKGNENAYYVRLKNVYDDRYRVDIFNKHHVSGSISDSLTLTNSYFLRVKDGEVKDLTIRSTEEDNKKFI